MGSYVEKNRGKLTFFLDVPCRGPDSRSGLRSKNGLGAERIRRGFILMARPYFDVPRLGVSSGILSAMLHPQCL